MRVIDAYRASDDVAVCDCGSCDAAYSIWVMGDKRVKVPVNDWDCSCKAWRKGLGFTMQKASEALGVPIKTWESWEYGSRQPSGFAKEAITSKMVKFLKIKKRNMRTEVRENKPIKD
ncbi:MAG: XRE family transcriptional regulator [Actinobacteria bacterium]|nr:XRE family transcriptional regulator [Actinomycetota bacterium]